MDGKVLQLCLSDGNGGMELYVDRVMEDLQEKGWKIFGICLANTKVEAYMRRNGATFRAFKNHRQALFNIFALRRWLLEENVTVIHCHKSSDLRLTTLLKLLLPKLKVIYTDHMGGLRPKKSLYHRIAYGYVDLLLSISQVTHQRNINNLPLARERIVCLLHGVDITKYQPCHDASAIRCKRESLGLSADAVLIGLPGRVTPGKGQAVWVKSLLALDPALNFHAISIGGTGDATGGDESFYAQLQKDIAGTELEGKITFLGHRSDLTEILPVLDMVCIPSKNEAFGLTIIESMACGLPIIGSNTGSLPELVDANSGILVGPTDVSAWRNAMDVMIRNEVQRKSMGNAARQRVEQHFSNKQHMKRLSEYYDALI
ncbi:Glycosyltransferase involved in cell wall bisynthesis [Vreelandella subterranea]|uniref:Glycosyltransferase involved in cell wall bisynthesis n=1 Tax=Vreelandella subterranea TaxID=416874 RepID=A0A1H9Q4Z0_9GAMM|nr:glycosyltransferase family 4 protein [Halomonas subterranea]SER55510.1 Glycosyltransferase involved in cell wall bisynthesis [Halomonas subterranea]